MTKATSSHLAVVSSLVLLVTGCVGEPVAPASPPPVTVPRSERFDMTSGGRTYRISVALPERPPGPEGHPTLYVLDAHSMFFTAVDVVRAWARRPRGSVDAIVVGIGYPEGVDVEAARAHDLTPEPPKGSAPPAFMRPGMTFGGADAFLRFLRTELQPELARRYPVDARREALFGHSFGGLFTLYTLLADPDAFDVYLAASPSLWFGGGLIAERVGALEAAPTARVLLVNGEYEQRLPPGLAEAPGAAARAAQLTKLAQLDRASAFAAQLRRQPSLSVAHVILAAEDHGSVVPAALGRAVGAFLGPDAPAR